jgi:hypothetical protein
MRGTLAAFGFVNEAASKSRRLFEVTCNPRRCTREAASGGFANEPY